MDTKNIYGKVSIWRNESNNPKAPVATGKIQDEYGNVIGEISLWLNESGNEKAPYLRGTIKPPYKPEEQNKSTTKRVGTAMF